MILCSQHARAVTGPICALQTRAERAMLETQRDGDHVMVLLVDRDDPDHIALASIGVDPALAVRLFMTAGMELARKKSGAPP